MAITFSNGGNYRPHARYNSLFSGGNATTNKDSRIGWLNANNDCNIPTGSLSNSNHPGTGTSRTGSSELPNWSHS
ncbi:MAG: hypothetical protein ACRDIV_16000 [Ktedonobacteraceae bacterium]